MFYEPRRINNPLFTPDYTAEIGSYVKNKLGVVAPGTTTNPPPAATPAATPAAQQQQAPTWKLDPSLQDSYILESDVPAEELQKLREKHRKLMITYKGIMPPPLRYQGREVLSPSGLSSRWNMNGFGYDENGVIHKRPGLFGRIGGWLSGKGTPKLQRFEHPWFKRKGSTYGGLVRAPSNDWHLKNMAGAGIQAQQKTAGLYKKAVAMSAQQKTAGAIFERAWGGEAVSPFSAFAWLKGAPKEDDPPKSGPMSLLAPGWRTQSMRLHTAATHGNKTPRWQSFVEGAGKAKDLILFPAYLVGAGAAALTKGRNTEDQKKYEQRSKLWHLIPGYSTYSSYKNTGYTSRWQRNNYQDVDSTKK